MIPSILLLAIFFVLLSLFIQAGQQEEPRVPSSMILRIGAPTEE